jgi:hypothetical protein
VIFLVVNLQFCRYLKYKITFGRTGPDIWN